MNKPRPTNEALSFVHSGLSPLSCRDITVTFILSLFNPRAYQSQIAPKSIYSPKGKLRVTKCLAMAANANEETNADSSVSTLTIQMQVDI